ncbi:hypothetical protein PGTUg99_022207 [Puccinia graminis f. sp. tritici]|uniref:Uncharacterized protein n=2 Tax=Puccinia graminis f. sp. tritici TaxID=56615 RepID=E3JYV1_PUCGT|nr:uncharacterized protein PGTG_03182 [Puccinia graminis f. sp. tritici CRL 75-36-700-3]EFP77226.2 hypothetical protein PGTG_03182 [Puccinia graminis f. sp. tritici CRL 75-36-700-3]KAA1124282.1 hypothetical protein PGTUg99_022207 [Puccinia graminis f. sp. tritici]
MQQRNVATFGCRRLSATSGTVNSLYGTLNSSLGAQLRLPTYTQISLHSKSQPTMFLKDLIPNSFIIYAVFGMPLLPSVQLIKLQEPSIVRRLQPQHNCDVHYMDNSIFTDASKHQLCPPYEVTPHRNIF